MATVHEIKTAEVVETPVLLFECRLGNGHVERWATHGIGGYSARVLGHNLFEFRSAEDGGIDAVSRVTVRLANADSHFSQVQRAAGFKGAALTVSFVFADASSKQFASEPVVVFKGVGDPPDEITESYLQLTFTSRMSMQRILLPQIRVQRRCPWTFPTSAEQRTEALEGGAKGRYSTFYRCGYSADLEGGRGNPGFTSCDYSRAGCSARGMFDLDAAGRVTRRFGGIEFVPSTINVKTYGERSAHVSGAVENEAKYNDFVPMVYGTAWYRPPVVFARNDGNLTRMEVLLGIGPIEGVLKVVVNGNELPAGNLATHATATGWYNLVSAGYREGAFNLDFANTAGTPIGDPYGSMAVLSVVVPNRISDGSPLPKIDVLLNGMRLPVYDDAGAYVREEFSNNPGWVLLDLLRRAGWGEDELDLGSFARTATYCAEPLSTTDLNGNERTVPRFQCNLVLRRRRSAADVIRGVRNGAGLFLTYGPGGLLQLHPESSIAVQQPDKPECSNSSEELAGGWPAYEFGDGSNSFGDIVRLPDGRPSLRVWSRSTAESPNRFTLEFQDEFNEYQQDSLSLVDLMDTLVTGHEVAAPLTALGVPNYNQAARVIRIQLDRSLRGNTYIEFESGMRAFGLKPGDLITLTYLKEGFERQAFRVLRLRPGMNFSTVKITAQIHDDNWYSGQDENPGLLGGGRQPSVENGIPRPLAGTILDDEGGSRFGVVESYGQDSAELSVAFVAPPPVPQSAPPVPLVSIAADVNAAGGTLKGGANYYYGVAAVASDGSESALSFIAHVMTPSSSDECSVTLRGLSFAPDTVTFRVYRGSTPTSLLRIAEDVPVAAAFTDTGTALSLAVPTDSNYHHANFYWRAELVPESQATLRSLTTVGNPALGMTANEYRGRTVRITRGRGKGQERLVASNDETTLNLTKPWTLTPDDTSQFVVAESTWVFAAMALASPATFTVPYRQHAVVHILGRSANVHDRECAAELSPLVRHALGGGTADTDVPDAPIFAMFTNGRGTFEIGAVGFERFDNTRSITAATATVHYWDETRAGEPATLTDAADAASDTIRVQSISGIYKGVLLQIGPEIVVVQSFNAEKTVLEVQRAAYRTTASQHEPGEVVNVLLRKTVVMPFTRGFFGTPASGSYSHTVALPNARIVAADMFVTNSRGNSLVSTLEFTGATHYGLRTLTGGQFLLQVDGMLSVQSSAVPEVVVDTDRAVRDVFATVAEAPSDAPVKVRVTCNGSTYKELTIPAGATVSAPIAGAIDPVLHRDARLGLDIVEVGSSGTPGAGLTVTIRV